MRSTRWLAWRNPCDGCLAGIGFLGFFKVTGGLILGPVGGLGEPIRREDPVLVLPNRLAIAGVITTVCHSIRLVWVEAALAAVAFAALCVVVLSVAPRKAGRRPGHPNPPRNVGLWPAHHTNCASR